MDLRSYARMGSRFFTDNSPAIMTGIGVVGVVGTALLTGKATVLAMEKLHEVRVDENEEKGYTDYNQFESLSLTKKEKLGLTWKFYIPAVGVGALSITAIIAANRVGARRAAALATAYALLEGDFDEYKEKVAEKLSPAKQKELKEELTKSRVNRNRSSATHLPIPGEGLVLLHDDSTGRFFPGTVENVRAAANDVGETILNNDHATVSDFYTKIGLKPTTHSSEFGWNPENKLTLEWTTVPGQNDGDPAAHSFEFGAPPVYRPWKRDSSQ